MTDKKASPAHLKALGSQQTSYSADYNPDVLETFELGYSDEATTIELECPEFTSLCPKTAQPDFATVIIRYCPRRLCVESKSLKLYLFSFRNEGSFHESCINTIARDLMKLMQPHWITVRGDFYPRGGISINPEVHLVGSIERPEPKTEKIH